MKVICPTITAYDTHEYRAQMERIEPFATRVHIDLMDGVFAPTKSPDLSTIWWPEGLVADIHIMYVRPIDALAELLRLHPHMVVVHYEAEGVSEDMLQQLHAAGVAVGLALLHDTPVEPALVRLAGFDQVLIFSGKLGYHGGDADLTLLEKVAKVREAYPEMEIAWDGGINEDNVEALVRGGVNVLNVGGTIQKSAEPEKAYATLEALVQSL